jgi:hypothetical protein
MNLTQTQLQLTSNQRKRNPFGHGKVGRGWNALKLARRKSSRSPRAKTVTNDATIPDATNGSPKATHGRTGRRQNFVELVDRISHKTPATTKLDDAKLQMLIQKKRGAARERSGKSPGAANRSLSPAQIKVYQTRTRTQIFTWKTQTEKTRNAQRRSHYNWRSITIHERTYPLHTINMMYLSLIYSMTSWDYI